MELCVVLLIIQVINGFNYVTAVHDYAVNQEGIDHGVEMHHAYSKVASNGGQVVVTRKVVKKIPVAIAVEVNELEEIYPVHHSVQHTGSTRQEYVTQKTVTEQSVQENLLDGIEPVGTECPPHATGSFPYLMDCKKYLNCYKGQGMVLDCAPGTLFNPKIKQCDMPGKVKCVTLDTGADNTHIHQEHNTKLAQEQPFAQIQTSHATYHSARPDIAVDQLPAASHTVSTYSSRTGRTETGTSTHQVDERPQRSYTRPVCPPGASGLIPHPYDCAKFLNCDESHTVTQNCGPGTVFNPKIKVCDMPENVECSTLNTNGDNQHTYQEHNTRVVQGQPFAQALIQASHSTSYHGRPDVPVDQLPAASHTVSTYSSRNGKSETRTSARQLDEQPQRDHGRPVCPPGAVGLLPHPYDCAKFLNCDGVHSVIQDCGPGTVFNPEIQVCDWPDNVNCDDRTGRFAKIREPEQTQIDHDDPIYSGIDMIDARLTEERSGRQERDNSGFYKPVCPQGYVGLMEHPYDCSKYLNCHGGRTFIHDCGPGTQFNTKTQVCDWPHKVKCKIEPGVRESFRIPKQEEIMVVRPTVYLRTTDLETESQHSGPVYVKRPTQSSDRSTPSYGGKKPYYYQTTTPLPSVRSTRFPPRHHAAESMDRPIYVHPTTDIEQPVRAHQSPIYHEERGKVPRKQVFSRPSTTTTTPLPRVATPRQRVTPTDNYNRQYYNNNRNFTDEEVSLPDEMSTISEALKILLKPYMKGTETNITMPVETRISTGSTEKTDLKYTVSDEQMSLAGEDRILLDHDVQESKPDYVTIRPQITTTAKPNLKPWQPGFVHSPEWHAQGPHKHNQHHHHGSGRQHNEEWHRQHGVPMPGGHNQQHHHSVGHKHNPEWHRQNGIPVTEERPTTKIVPNHQHHHHSGGGQHNEDWHRRHGIPMPGHKHPEQPKAPTPTTQVPAIPAPIDPRFEQVETTTPIVYFNREPKKVIPLKTTTTPPTITSTECNGFKCTSGKCIANNNLCNGKNDCGDRSDESNCAHVGYEVRLSSNTGKKHEGRVEVKVFGQWGYVCDDKFNMNAANVLCKELGFPMGAAEVRLNSYYAPNKELVDGEDTIFIMDEVECSGNETSIKDCEFNGWGVHDCNADEVVGVVCKIPIMTCPSDYWLCEMSQECIPTQFMCDNVYDCADHSDESPKFCNSSLEIRLVDGNSKHEGRVEVKYRGVWGTICDDDFGTEEANVICRQLGFEGESSVVKGKFGQGKGPIWLDQVNCIGNESTIDDCIHWQWGEHNCAHTEDVGVKCYDGTQRIARTRTSNVKGKLQTRFEDFPFAEKSSKHLPEQCGRVKVTPTKSPYHERIVSGTQTQRGMIPWQASIRAKKHGKSAHWCGAVLISRHHIITAAHCLIGYPKGAYMVRLGDHRTDETEPSEMEVYIENMYIHEDFRKGQHMNNDIAMILLKSPIRFSNYIQPVCLPEKNAYYQPGMNCTISGWGAVQSGSTMTSLDLRAGQVPIQSVDICKQPGVYGDAITEGMFCAGSLDKGVDACDGDSGGPLVCEVNGVHTLYGVISWGQHCGFINKPGVYVKIAHYIDWIQEKLEHSMRTFGV